MLVNVVFTGVHNNTVNVYNNNIKIVCNKFTNEFFVVSKASR